MFAGIYDTYRTVACCDMHIHSYFTITSFWHKAPLLKKTVSWMLSLSLVRWLVLLQMFGIHFWFKLTVNISNSREIDAVHEEYKQKLRDQEAFHRKQIKRQQLYVENLKQQIVRGQSKAEQELENDQALINQQIQESGYLPLPLSHFHYCILASSWCFCSSYIFYYGWNFYYALLLVFSYNCLTLENSYEVLINRTV